MEVNDQVISQGIVFASIVAGFAFVIAAEIALREPLPTELEHPAISFLITGLIGVVTAGTGVLYFGNTQNPTQQAELSNYFLLLMGGTGLTFLGSILSLFQRRFSGRTLRDFFIIMATITVIVATLIWTTYL